jgi:hypothetical protein
LLLLILGLGLANAGARAEAPASLTFGVQAGLALPTGDDLRVTVGSGLNPMFGFHLTWAFNDRHSLRPRLEYWAFNRGVQEVQSPQLQRIDTKVQGLVLGGEYLFRPGACKGRWAAGAGLYLVRWSVASINQVYSPSGDTARAAGTSHWGRAGAGLVATFQLSTRLDAEARWIASRYGYENLPANLGTVGLLWRF